MEYIVTSINGLLNFWVDTAWYIALAMSALVNLLVFFTAAYSVDKLSLWFSKELKCGAYIDTRPLKANQKQREMKYGAISCLIFAVGSLFTRELYSDLWPNTVFNFVWQVLVFSVYYETYSYFVHRVLHTKHFSKYHAVHHWSVRVTPWSAYSVHPVEATLIAISAPIFMAIFPLSLGVAFVLHIMGMVFTITLHSNYQFANGRFSGYMLYHQFHHSRGSVNFGFVNKYWDTLLKTKRCS